MSAIRESGTTLLASFDYDQLGRRDRLVLGNGAVTDYQYDSASRLWKLIHDPAGTGHDNTIELTYNPAGQIVGRTASNNAWKTVTVTNFVSLPTERLARQLSAFRNRADETISLGQGAPGRNLSRPAPRAATALPTAPPADASASHALRSRYSLAINRRTVS